MSLFNPYANSVTDPRSARSAKLVVLANNGVLTEAQRNGVAHYYAQFAMLASTSAAPYLVRDVSLPDGTKVRMVVNGNEHTVYAWPPSAEETTPISDTFYAVPNSLATYGYFEWDPKYSGIWKFRGKTEPPEELDSKRTITDEPTVYQHPGNLTWWSADLLSKGREVVVSWYGRATRYGRLDYHGAHKQRCNNDTHFQHLYSPYPFPGSIRHITNWFNAFKPAVWMNGVKHDVRKIIAAGDPPTYDNVYVLSAALRAIEDEDPAVAGLYLYVVTRDTSLAVYRGRIGAAGQDLDVYSGNPITVAKLFDIDYTPGTTSFGSNDDNNQWETLLQPFYFNKSATECASLVTVRRDSTTNVTAEAATVKPIPNNHAVRLCTVNIDAATTAFTSEHANILDTATWSGTEGLGPVEMTVDGATFFIWPTGSFSATGSYERKFIKYLAVDYQGDQRVVVMGESWTKQEVSESGHITGTSGDAPVTAAKTGTNTATSGWRVYKLHNDQTIAAAGPIIAGTTTVHMESADQNSSGGGTASGYRNENLTQPLVRFVTLEGGDVRHEKYIINEVMEAGESTYSDTIHPPGGSTIASNQANPWSGRHVYGSGVYGGWGSVSRSNQTAFGRYHAMRLSMWSNGAKIAETAIVEAVTMFQSIGGYLGGDAITSPPYHSFNVENWFEYRGFGNGATSQPGHDYIQQFNMASPMRARTPFKATGFGYVNTFAIDPSGEYWFYNIGSFYADGMANYVHSNPSVAPLRAGWSIKGALKPFDGTKYFPVLNAHQPVLSSPVFVNNSPEGS